MLLVAKADPNLRSRQEAHLVADFGLGHPAGMAPLHFAAAAGSAPCVRQLLLARASPLIRDDHAQLPLFRCPDDASEARELLLRALVTEDLSQDAEQPPGSARVKRERLLAEYAELLSVRLKVHALGPVRELHVGLVEKQHVTEEMATSRRGGWRGLFGRPSSAAAARAAADGRSRAEPAERVCKLGNLKLSLHLRRVGLTIIDDEPQEVNALDCACLIALDCACHHR